MSFPALAHLLVALGYPLAQDSLCAAHTRDADPSIYCLPLFSTAKAPLASGTARLQLQPGPLGLSVTRDGRVLSRVVLTLSGLPDPASLGPYHSFVAWATTPDLDPVIPLGAVENGRTVTGPIALERFIIMVSAERSARARTREGPLILRGSSPSQLMAPHGVTRLPPARRLEHEHRKPGWTMPPMHPTASRMPYGLERFAPDVTPFLPAYLGRSLPGAVPSRSYQLSDGDTITLTAGKVGRTLRGHELVMYAYDGQIPGPRLEIPQGATVTVRFRNLTDSPATHVPRWVLSATRTRAYS